MHEIDLFSNMSAQIRISISSIKMYSMQSAFLFVVINSGSREQ